MILNFVPSPTSRLIVIGDVHGCSDELAAILLKVNRTDDDHLLFLGDLVNRGPDSLGVLGVVQMMVEAGKATSLLGNHEEKHIRFAHHEQIEKSTGKTNPMRFGAMRMEEHRQLSPDDIDWMAHLPTFVRFKDAERSWIGTHAGIPSDKPIDEQPIRDLIRTRWVNAETGKYATSRGDPRVIPEGATYWTKRWQGPDSVIYGHQVFREPPLVFSGTNSVVLTLGIDTGACFGGSLTAAIFSGEGGIPNLVSVKSSREYYRRTGILPGEAYAIIKTDS